MTQRSHSEIIRTMGVEVPPHAQDYNSQAYLDWLATIPAANAEMQAPDPPPSPKPEFRRVVDERGQQWTILRGWWG